MTKRSLLATASLAICTCFGPEVKAEPVSSTGKAITGGALLGGELVVFTQAAVGFESPWYFALGGGLGAVGGGVGGYFIEEGGNPELSLYMLFGGMTLLIPASITYLNATAYHPEEPEPVDAPPSSVDEEVQLSGGAAWHLRRSTAPSWVSVTEGELHVGVPNVVIERSFTELERREFGAPASSSLMLPLVSGNF